MKQAMTFGKTILVGLASVVFLGGCATPTSEDDFGNSVRRMIDAQKYTPPAQKERKMPLLDGQKAEASAQQYRKDTGNPIHIYQDMGSGTSQK